MSGVDAVFHSSSKQTADASYCRVGVHVADTHEQLYTAREGTGVQPVLVSLKYDEAVEVLAFTVQRHVRVAHGCRKASGSTCNHVLNG